MKYWGTLKCISCVYIQVHYKSYTNLVYNKKSLHELNLKDTVAVPLMNMVYGIYVYRKWNLGELGNVCRACVHVYRYYMCIIKLFPGPACSYFSAFFWRDWYYKAGGIALWIHHTCHIIYQFLFKTINNCKSATFFFSHWLCTRVGWKVHRLTMMQY